MENRQEVIGKVKRYIVEVLEPARAEFSGLSACPFVKPERLNDNIMYDVLGALETFEDLAKRFDESDYTTAIFVQLFPEGESMTPKEGSEYQQFLNAVLKQNGLGKHKVICINPNQDHDVEGFSPRAHAPFFIVNIAPRRDLDKAHKSLMKTGYFDNFSEEYRRYLNVNKRKEKKI
jgi:hypothetical protein